MSDLTGYQVSDFSGRLRPISFYQFQPVFAYGILSRPANENPGFSQNLHSSRVVINVLFLLRQASVSLLSPDTPRLQNVAKVSHQCYAPHKTLCLRVLLRNQEWWYEQLQRHLLPGLQYPHLRTRHCHRLL